MEKFPSRFKMPTYEFRCPDGHDFENFYRSIGSAPTEVLCPTCGKAASRQLSAGGGLMFKGSGFYITDYGKDGKKSQLAVPAKDSDSTKPAGDSPAPKSESSAGPDKGSAGSSGDAVASSAASEPKTAAAPAKKPKTGE